jgi:hypothetical protein
MIFLLRLKNYKSLKGSFQKGGDNVENRGIKDGIHKGIGG